MYTFFLSWIIFIISTFCYIYFQTHISTLIQENTRILQYNNIYIGVCVCACVCGCVRQRYTLNGRQMGRRLLFNSPPPVALFVCTRGNIVFYYYYYFFFLMGMKCAQLASDEVFIRSSESLNAIAASRSQYHINLFLKDPAPKFFRTRLFCRPYDNSIATNRLIRLMATNGRDIIITVCYDSYREPFETCEPVEHDNIIAYREGILLDRTPIMFK